MSAITTHILDTARGQPAVGVQVELAVNDGPAWRRIGRGVSDQDGRLRALMPDNAVLERSVYRLTFETGEYFRGLNTASFHPRIIVEFTVADGESHYHVPLLLSPYGYTTYRGT